VTVPSHVAAPPKTSRVSALASVLSWARPAKMIAAVVALLLTGTLIFVGIRLSGGHQTAAARSTTPTTTVQPTSSTSPAPTPVVPPPPTVTTPPTTETTSTTTTTTTSAVASAPAIGEPCNDWSKIARDPNTGLTIICDGGTGAGAPPTHWTTDDLSNVIGVETIGTSCAGFQPYTMAISPDDYPIACFPADAGIGQLAGPGSTWKIYHPLASFLSSAGAPPSTIRAGDVGLRRTLPAAECAGGAAHSRPHRESGRPRPLDVLTPMRL
jgi:hypothetical protein